MTTPTPGGEPFADAMAEAVQTSVQAVRLIMAIADAVRRQTQRRERGTEQDLPPSDQAIPEAAGELKGLVPSDIATGLMVGADWPQMAQQLVALRRAGVDLSQFLPRVAEVAVTVRDAVAANAARVAGDGTEEWTRLLRETVPAGPVREAILSSPAWPDIAATMAGLQERGVDVRQILVAAHDEGVGVDQAVARVLAAGSVPGTSRDATLSYGPLTVGLDIPRNLYLGDRKRALVQLAIDPQDNERYMRWIREAMPGRERDADLLVSSRQWPLVAARMAWMESPSQGLPVQDRLARLADDTSWEQGPTPQLGSRLVQAAVEALRRPVTEGVTGSRVRVSTAAARAQSVTVGPTTPQAKGAATAEPGAAPHRTSGPARGAGRTR
ncbi:hypothetical protein [Streptomyces sp. NPDC058475]|uniref:hypothetical protein n=1 Tax=unclassified Streptomyces TaxID=2593676 RepID=UPI0036632137